MHERFAGIDLQAAALSICVEYDATFNGFGNAIVSPSQTNVKAKEEEPQHLSSFAVYQTSLPELFYLTPNCIARF